MAKCKNKININTILVLVCVILCICALCISLIISKKDITSAKNDNEIMNEIKTNMETDSVSYTFTKWEDMNISAQFSSFVYNNNRYNSQITKIASENIDKKIGDETLTGVEFNSWEEQFKYYYQHYGSDYTGPESGTVHNKRAELFSIKNISKECAIAVNFEGDNDYYVYIQTYYRPTTLGEFMKDANLKEITSFGSVHYQFYDKDIDVYTDIEFHNVDNKMIWDKLFSNLSLENIYDDSMVPFKYGAKEFNINISVSIPLLGYKNKTVGLTDTGYLTTNILDLGKTFYIGEDKVREFLDYIKENYDGYKIQYHNE